MAQYFCRVCDSSNGWVQPSNRAHETFASHHGKYHFAYEEWNFNPALLINGWQYGWIEGFKSGVGRTIVPPGNHDLVLYIWRSGAAFAVGRLNSCEKINNAQSSLIYPSILATQANSVGARVLVSGSTWDVSSIGGAPISSYSQIPTSNMRFRLRDARLFASPFGIQLKYTRYGALDVARNAQRTATWASLP